jgi:hypothetical protein
MIAFCLTLRPFAMSVGSVCVRRRKKKEERREKVSFFRVCKLDKEQRLRFSKSDANIKKNYTHILNHV